MNEYVQYLTKTAGLSPTGARSLEALIGAVIGGVSGGLMGMGSFKPEQPTEWLDEYGHVQGRNLTSKERAAKNKRAKKGALIGATTGVGATPAFSAIRRGLRTSAESKALPGMKRSVLNPLRAAAKDLDRIAARAESRTGRYKPGSPADALGGFDDASAALNKAKARSAEAKRLLGQEEQRITDLLYAAQQERDKRLFGGLKTWRQVPSPSTHEGQIIKAHGGPDKVKLVPKAEHHGFTATKGLTASFPKSYWMKQIIEKTGAKKLTAKQFAKIRKSLEDEQTHELDPAPAIATDPFPSKPAPK